MELATKQDLMQFKAEICAKIDQSIRSAFNPMLSREDSASYLGVSVESIDLAKRSGKLKPKFIGRRPFYKRTDLDGLFTK